MHNRISVSKILDKSLINRPLSQLAKNSIERLASVPFEEIKDAGIWRNREHYFLNISYPSMQAMEGVDHRKLWVSPVQNEKRKIALYIHIPFCTAECYYCHYYKKFSQSTEAVDSYLDALSKELEMQCERLGSLEAKSIYVGGGTPSYLNPKQISRLLLTIKQYVSVPRNVEITFEIHPESGTIDRIEILKEHGVNRINIGIETFEDKTLLSENRRHTARQAIELFEKIKSMDFAIINLDLIYGLRGQTLEGWEYNLDQIAKLLPQSVTLYFLRLKRGTPEFKLWKLYPRTFPTDGKLILMHAMSFQRMEEELKYFQRPVDWFIRDDRFFHEYQDHNWRRTDEVDLLGIGASAYSYIDGWQYYNSNDTESYQKLVLSGNLPIWRAEYLDKDERMRRTLMLGLKIGIERVDFLKIYGVDVVDYFDSIWKDLIDLGLVSIDPVTVSLTYSGKLFADEVGQRFYSKRMQQRMASVDPELVSTTWPQFNP